MTRLVSAPARTRLGRLAFAAGLLALAVAAPAAAQSPEPTPALTFAPLVTFPPIQPPAQPTPTELADGYSLGRADAPITVEVWEDFQCPYCQRWTELIKPQVVSQLVESGLVRLTFRPLAFIGEESRWAAVAADLAAEQNRFWPMQDLLYANQLGENKGAFNLDRILLIAEAAGLDMDAFRQGLVLDAARERFARLEEASRLDASMLGINATPSVVVNGVLLESPDFESIATAVAAALPAASPATGPAEASPAS